MVEEEFVKLYKEDSNFRMALEGTSMSNLTLRDKNELIIAYSRRREEGSSENSRLGIHRMQSDPCSVEVDGEYVTYRGKKYKRV